MLWGCGVPLLLAGAIGVALSMSASRLIRRHLTFVPPVVIGLTIVAVPRLQLARRPASGRA